MLRVAEQQIRKGLQALPDHGPDYDSMWQRIRTEVERRRSGWNEQVDTSNDKRFVSRSRQWIMAASAAAVVIAAGGTAAYFSPSEGSEPTAADVGQQLQATAEVDGVRLTLNNAAIGLQPLAEENQMSLRMTLNDTQGRSFDAAEFGEATLTDLDTGKNLERSGTKRDLFRQEAPGEDYALTQYFAGSLPVAGETKRYRLTMKDLFLNETAETPLGNELVEGQEYAVIPEDDLRIKINAYDWGSGDQRLNVSYEANKDWPKSQSDSLPSTFTKEPGKLTIKNGEKLLTSPVWGSINAEQVWSRNTTFMFHNVNGEKPQDLTFFYAYVKTVDKANGEWTIDFTVQGSQAAASDYTLSIDGQQSLEERTGMKLPEAIASPFRIKIPVIRQEADAKQSAGRFLFYQETILQVDDMEIPGLQAPIPGQEYVPPGIDPKAPETITFNLAQDSLSDLSGKSLTLKLRNAVVMNEYPEIWTSIEPPAAQAQSVKETMPDQSIMAYKVTRKGKDVHVQTLTENKFYLISGTQLKVDGKTYESDSNETSSKYAGDFGYRIDVFKNVPEGSDFSINAGSYGVYDSSRDLDLPISQ
ncbi:hypothetical protein [Saccharibacillus sacchari]|uniref:Uncharacterized protein n=1 Tax=Saccharibacillus sacchari TaxID=456493 RepID=A0ACC6PI50_9BACL